MMELKIPKHLEKSFDKHKATVRQLDGVTEILWRQPTTFINYIVYLIRRNRLYVAGDLGSAVYAWGQDVTLEWLAGLNLDYFAGKCEGSEKGAGYQEWDGQYAKERILLLPERGFGWEKGTPGHQMAIEVYEHHKEELLEECDHEQAFTCLLSSIDHGERETLFGCDCDGYGTSLGKRISDRCLLHLWGLKEAHKQIAGGK